MERRVEGQEKEVWRPVKGFEGIYEVSNEGRVKSFNKNARGKFAKVARNGGLIMKERVKLGDKSHYAHVTLLHGNLRFDTSIHRLVAMHFIPNPQNKEYVNHKDGDKLNNVVSNLEWVTKSEDVKHAHDTGLNKSRYSEKQKAWTRKMGYLNRRTKFEIAQDIRELESRFKFGATKIARLYGFSRGMVMDIISGRTYAING